MKKALIGKKIGMTQIFDEQGKVIPATAIEVGPCTVMQIKTVEQDGYQAVQLGFGDVKESKLTKPELGKFKKNKLQPKKYLREVRLDSIEGIKVGDELKADVFAVGDKVDIQGIIIVQISRYHTSTPLVNPLHNFSSENTRKVAAIFRFHIDRDQLGTICLICRTVICFTFIICVIS